MSWARVLPLGVGIIGATLLVAAASVWRVELRHSAPYGFSKTIDFDRLIAVRGGYVTANYDGFNRLDLDLRAYAPGTTYDLTIHIRPIAPGAADVRTLQIDLPASRIPAGKGTFANPFVTVRFPEIDNSAGQTYYVWVEPGIRNRDEVVALWSIKSYSRVPAWQVVSAFVNEAPGGSGQEVIRVALILLLGGLVFSTGWFLSRIVAAAFPMPGELNERLMRWHRRETDGIQ